MKTLNDQEINTIQSMLDIIGCTKNPGLIEQTKAMIKAILTRALGK